MMSSFSQPKALNHYSQERSQLFNISLVGFRVTVFLFLNPAKSSYRFYPQAPSRVLSHISDFNPTDTADGSSQPPSFAGNSTTQMRFHPRFFSTMITRQDLGAAAQQHLPSGKLTQLLKITIFSGSIKLFVAMFNSYVKLPEGISFLLMKIATFGPMLADQIPSMNRVRFCQMTR